MCYARITEEQKQPDSIFVVEVGSLAVAAYKATSLHEPNGLLQETWFLNELRGLIFKGRTVWDGRSRLRTRSANGPEIAAFNEMTADDGIMDFPLAYLLPLDEVPG